MTVFWVLLMMNTAGGGYVITTHEFAGKENCELAREAVQRTFGAKAVCAKK